MRIRQIILDDFDEAYDLWKQVGLWVRPIDEERMRFQEMLRLNQDLCFAIEEDGKILGTVLGAYDGRSVSVHRLAVITELQKKGYGTRLVETLEQKTKEKGIRKIFLQVHISNEKVLLFYKSLGYIDDPLTTLKKDL